MTFSTNVAKQSIPKYSLVILRPRRYLTDWTAVGGGVYSTPFDFGRVVRMWFVYGEDELTRKTTLTALGAEEFYHDIQNGILYIGAGSPPTNRTAEYELCLSNREFKAGPCDPLDPDSEVVEWIPALVKEPLPQNGSRDTQLGFSPLFSSQVEINNADGWLDEHLHETSFNLAFCRGYVIANEDLEAGIRNGDVQATLLGYCGKSISGLTTVSVPVNDFFRFLDKPAAPLYRFVTADFPGYIIQPDASVIGNEWYVRRVRGMLDGHVPTNIDLGVPSTTTNRVWITQENDLNLEDSSFLDEGTYTYIVDHLAANDDNNTYFTTTHQLNAGDWMAITNNGVTRYIYVLSVDRPNKKIIHSSVAGRTVVSGDSAIRYFIGSITIRDSDNIPFDLRPGVDYTRFYGHLNGIPNVLGFTLADNFEAAIGFTDNGGVFDPSQHQIVCRVYGPKELGKYSDGSTDVGETDDDGGIDATAVGILYYLLRLAGIDQDIIDEASFQDLTAGAHALGLAWPPTPDQGLSTYKELITQVLQSVIWRMAFVQSGNDIKIGLVPTEPISAADEEADELDCRLEEYGHDYNDIYHVVSAEYAHRESLIDSRASALYVTAQNDLARDLHLVTDQLDVVLLQYVEAEAQAIADRLSFMFGDRRGFYTLALEQSFLDRAQVGTKYDLIQQQLPGFPFVFGTRRTRSMQAIELQKSTQGVTLVLEDQKGIQDNQGDW